MLAWAGYKDVAQAFALSFREAPVDLSEPRSAVARAARERFGRIREDTDVEHRSEANEFMLAWFSRRDRKPVAFHLHLRGAVVWVEDWEYAGNPQAIATARAVEASLSYVVIENLGAEQVSLVVLKVLRDSIAAAGPAAMINGPVQLAHVTNSGIHILDAAELRATSDALDVWEERSAELLPGAAGPPAKDRPPDRGLRPPS